MAQTGYTPISLYYSATASAAPTSGNLVAGELAINTNDGVIYYKDSSGVVQSIASKASNSGSFTNLAYTGTLTGGTGVVNLGSGQFYKDSSGNVGIGTNSPSSYGNLAVASTTGAAVVNIRNNSGAIYTAALKFSQSGSGGDTRIQSEVANDNLQFVTVGTERMRIDSNGYLFCAGVYNNTTANAANVYVYGSGDLTRSTSSRKYKTDIVNYDKGLAEVMQLRPVSYKGINDGEKQFAGLIAEEVEEIGLTEFVQHAEDGTPDALAYPHMIALLIKAIQEQQVMIEELKAKVSALEAA